MKQELKQVLAQRQKNRILDASKKAAAVLLPIYEKHGRDHILFTQRTDKVEDHKGQISFPGGAFEPQDITLSHAALREGQEEIGLDSSVVELLGELDDLPTHTNYLISPFVGTIPWPYNFKRDLTEVAEIFDVPLLELLDKDCLHPATFASNNRVITANAYHYRDKVIWGATASILTQFLEIYSRVMQDIKVK